MNYKYLLITICIQFSVFVLMAHMKPFCGDTICSYISDIVIAITSSILFIFFSCYTEKDKPEHCYDAIGAFIAICFFQCVFKMIVCCYKKRRGKLENCNCHKCVKFYFYINLISFANYNANLGRMNFFSHLLPNYL